MQYKYTVQEENGKPVFVMKSDNTHIALDELTDFEDFIGGKIEVFRDGELLSQTNSVRTFGTHGASAGMTGLREIFGDASPQNGPNFALHASQFQKGDTVVLESLESSVDLYTPYMERLHELRARSLSPQTIQPPAMKA